MFKYHNKIRTIPNVPCIPHIEPIEYDEDKDQIAEGNDSPRSQASSRYAASDAPSYRTELGSGDGKANIPPDHPAENNHTQQGSTSVDPLSPPLS